MDKPQRPEDGYIDPGRYVLATDAIKEAAIQTAINDVQYLMELESHGNANKFLCHGSADAREDLSSTRFGSDNICISGHSQGLHLSPSVDEMGGFITSQNHSDPYGMAVNISNPNQCWNHSATNYIVMNETYPDHTKTVTKIWGIFDNDLSTDRQQDTNYDKTLGLISSSKIAFHNSAVAGIEGQYTESHDDLSQIARSDNELCHISDVVASNSLTHSDGNFAASVSSGCHKEKITINVVDEMVQSSNIGDMKSLSVQKIKAVTCRICEDEISQHKIEVNVPQFDSLYYNMEGTNLRIHRSFHISKTPCNICGKEHAVGNLHKSEHRCPDPECTKRFPCRTLFYQHIPEHKNYFRKHCWVCRRNFKVHISENNSTTYVCCVCGHSTKYERYLKDHYLLHLPKCFCNLCKKEYSVQDKNFHVNEGKCIVCNDIFKCRIQLREHFEAHVKYFSEHCRIRECNIKYPLFRSPFDNSFHTSKDLFQHHLYEQAELVFLDCETCGRLFFPTLSLNNHKQSCKALHYKCEICETRFLTFDLFHSHGLMKHLN